MPRPSALDWRKLKAARFGAAIAGHLEKEMTERCATRNLVEFAPALIAVGEPPKSGMYREDLEPSPFMASQLRPPSFGADGRSTAICGCNGDSNTLFGRSDPTLDFECG